MYIEYTCTYENTLMHLTIELDICEELTFSSSLETRAPENADSTSAAKKIFRTQPQRG